MIHEISQIRRLPRVGKIHLGVKAKSQSDKEYPKAVDYFVVKEEETTPKEAVEAFKKVYGDNPKSLKVVFPVNDTTIFRDESYKKYVRATDGSGKLVCKGDGQRADRLNMQTGEIEEVSCPGPEDCPYALDKHGQPTGCRRIGFLQFMLPDVPLLGVWQIDTSSINGIISLNSYIDMVKTITKGSIRMIPMTLKLVPKKILFEGKQKTIFHLALSFEGAPADLLRIAGKNGDLPQLEMDPVNHEEVPEDHFPPAALDGPEERTQEECDATREAMLNKFRGEPVESEVRPPAVRKTSTIPLGLRATAAGLNPAQFQDLLMRCSGEKEVNAELLVLETCHDRKMKIEQALQFRARFKTAEQAFVALAAGNNGQVPSVPKTTSPVQFATPQTTVAGEETEDIDLAIGQECQRLGYTSTKRKMLLEEAFNGDKVSFYKKLQTIR